VYRALYYKGTLYIDTTAH